MNVYDFDGTIYDGDSTVDFFLFALRTTPKIVRYIPNQIIGFILYAVKCIQKTQLKEYFFSFLSGVNVELLVNNFWDQNQHKIYQWYLDNQRLDDIIISASPEFLLKPVCERIGVKNLIASKVDVKTGKFSGENCYGEEKVHRLFDEYHITHIDRFYSDSHSDLPVAKIASQAFLIKHGAVNKW